MQGLFSRVRGRSIAALGRRLPPLQWIVAGFSDVGYRVSESFLHQGEAEDFT